MTSEYAISIDWQEEYKTQPDKWINHGRQALENNCKHYEKGKKTQGDEPNLRYSGYCEKCDVSETKAEPMMNFVYPLDREPSEEKILEVVQRTALTVMQNSETGDYFLALCGGGMDFSQDIALAYNIVQKWIPYALALSVCTQYDLTTSGKDWEQMIKALAESIENNIRQGNNKLEQIKEELSKAPIVKVA